MISFKTEYKKATNVKTDALVVFLPSDDSGLEAARRKLAVMLGPAVTPVSIEDMNGETGVTHVLYTGGSFLSRRVILTGIGERVKVTAEILRRAGAAAARRAGEMKLSSIAFILDTVADIGLPSSDNKPAVSPFFPVNSASALAEGAALAIYQFSSYFSDGEKKNSTLKSAVFIAPSKKQVPEISSAVKKARIICEGVYLARDLGNTPGLDLYPETLAAAALKECRKTGCKVTVLNEKKIESLNMGGIISVSRGSVRPPRFIVIEWRGGKRNDKPYVLVGKGITFDTGGISIKPSANMGEMKMDMSGAAAVIGAIKTASAMKLRVNLVGLVPACENMPDGNALRPGDVIRIMGGKSVEVDNTDAEGRLILADALVYAKKLQPAAVVDLATLTGSCVVALGHYATGMMGNNDALIRALKEAGERSYERVWELPLYEEYEKLIKSDIADIKNVGGKWAGAITAGWFLKKFSDDYPWVHLDIAGTAISDENSGYTQRGASGVGVRLLIEWLENL